MFKQIQSYAAAFCVALLLSQSLSASSVPEAQTGEGNQVSVVQPNVETTLSRLQNPTTHAAVSTLFGGATVGGLLGSGLSVGLKNRQGFVLGLLVSAFGKLGLTATESVTGKPISQITVAPMYQQFAQKFPIASDGVGYAYGKAVTLIDNMTNEQKRGAFASQLAASTHKRIKEDAPKAFNSATTYAINNPTHVVTGLGFAVLAVVTRNKCRKFFDVSKAQQLAAQKAAPTIKVVVPETVKQTAKLSEVVAAAPAPVAQGTKIAEVAAATVK